MYCPKCGKELMDGANFCQFCGFKMTQNSTNDDIYSHSYYKDGYKKSHKKETEEFSFLSTFFKGVAGMFIFCLLVFALLLGKNYISGDLFSFDKVKYNQYIENPSSIPELTQPESLRGFIDNLKDVQDFLEMYLKYSDDSIEVKMETFDKYRKELLKFQNFDNANLLQENVTYQIPRDKSEFIKIQKQYSKLLSKVGLMVTADESYSKYRLQEDARYTYKRYGKYMPYDVNEYLKLRAKYYKETIFKDELQVKPYELAQRIGDYERFMNAHKDFRYSDEVKDLLFSYSFVYSFTSDRTNMIFINKKSFVKSDNKFMKKYPESQLKDLFSHLASSANGISESKFDELYPYEYQKTLDAIKPDKGDLSDVFSIVRKNIVELKSDYSFQYIYVSLSNSWVKYSSSVVLKKGDLILAQADDGYEIYDYKYKKTNQTIQLEPNAKFFMKGNQILAYSQNHLQIKSLDVNNGNLSFGTLSVKAIKKYFPNILIINIDTFGETSVQIDKPEGAKTYMLISTSGGNYENYSLSGDMTLGELNNIFTVSSDKAQVNWSSSDMDSDSYHMYFITQQAEIPQSEENAQ